MSLQFIGEAGIYLPDRDAIKVIAIAGDRAIDCYVTRSALEALGCRFTTDAIEIARRFETKRLDCEIAAMIKFRRATAPVLTLEIDAADLAVLDRVHAA